MYTHAQTNSPRPVLARRGFLLGVVGRARPDARDERLPLALGVPEDGAGLAELGVTHGTATVGQVSHRDAPATVAVAEGRLAPVEVVRRGSPTPSERSSYVTDIGASICRVSGSSPGLQTPLGTLALRLRCGSQTTDSVVGAISAVGPYADLWRWPELSGLRVELVLTGFRWPDGPSELAVDAAFGAVWTWTAVRDCDVVLIEATLPHDGSPANGECLEAREFETPEWVVAVGGPDDDCLGHEVETGRQPASWRGLLRPDCWDTDYGAVDRGPGTLAWLFPGLRAGETAVHHVAVAWKRNPGDEQQDVAPWLAVGSIRAEDLLTTSRS